MNFGPERDAFLRSHIVPRETSDKLDAFVELVLRENEAQNLVAKSTLASFWQRHMLDSAQVMPLASKDATTWLDVGSGAGLPGLVLAIMSNARHVLVEPRRLRADFLKHAAENLGLADRVAVVQDRVENVRGSFCVVTARAFASLSDTLAATIHLSDKRTQWILHKGRGATAQAEAAMHAWTGTLELIPSVTDPLASIVVARRSPVDFDR